MPECHHGKNCQHQHHKKQEEPIAKIKFANDYGVDLSRIKKISDDMSMTVDDAFSKHIHEMHHPYLHEIASRCMRSNMLTSAMQYHKINAHPPKKPVIYYVEKKRSKLENIKIDSLNTQRTKNIPEAGKEVSVFHHAFDDYGPMMIDVNDFSKSLYIPKTIQYMWSANNLEPNLALKLKADLQKHLDLSDKQRGNLLEDMMTIKTITKEDTLEYKCDWALIGQRGVFASKDISALTVLGVYTGIFLKDEHDMLTLNQKIPLVHFQDYLFRVPLEKTFPKITAFQHGNRLSLINAASNYQGSDKKVYDQIRKRANIMLVAAKTLECSVLQIAQDENCPDVMFFVAGRHIPKGEQLFYDYGSDYW